MKPKRNSKPKAKKPCTAKAKSTAKKKLESQNYGKLLEDKENPKQIYNSKYKATKAMKLKTKVKAKKDNYRPRKSQNYNSNCLDSDPKTSHM